MHEPPTTVARAPQERHDTCFAYSRYQVRLIDVSREQKAMSDWGGKRPGAGRPRGSRSPHVKARQEAGQEIVARFVADHPNAFPGDSVSLLQCIYRNPDLP